MNRKEHLLNKIPNIDYLLPLKELNLVLEAMEESTNEQLYLHGVVKSFYCGVVKRKEGEICPQQCAKCEWVEAKDRQ